MKSIVVYDTKFGNTERIARAIAERLSTGEPVPILPAGSASDTDVAGVDLLVVGGPTQGHGLSPALRALLDNLSPEAVRNVATATFDTRLTWPRFLAGSSAAASAKRLGRKGARLLVPSESFLVEGSEGPLVSRELARARVWASEVRAAAGLPEREPAGTTV